jgi:hypothetical protein
MLERVREALQGFFTLSAPIPPQSPGPVRGKPPSLEAISREEIEAPEEPATEEKRFDLALFHDHKTTCSIDREVYEGACDFYGEIYNPSQEWVMYVRLELSFYQRHGNTLIARRTVEFKCNIPPGESRPIQAMLDVDLSRFTHETYWWDYEVIEVGGRLDGPVLTGF